MATDERDVEAIALGAKELLDTMLEITDRHQLKRNLVLRLLGLFARGVVDLADDRDEAISNAMGLFADGLGVQIMAHKMVPPDAGVH